MKDPANPLLVARIGGAHGIKGEVRVKSLTEAPIAFAEYGPLLGSDGNRYEIIGARLARNMVITRFHGIDSREAAEALNGTELFVDRSALPENDAEDEYYVQDLIGMKARDKNGEAFGTVEAVHDFGAGDIVEIRLSSGKTELFAFTRENFPEIDLDAHRLVIVPPETVAGDETGPEQPS